VAIIPNRDKKKVPLLLRLLLLFTLIILSAIIGSISAIEFEVVWSTLAKAPIIGRYISDFSLGLVFWGALVTSFINYIFHLTYLKFRKL